MHFYDLWQIQHENNFLDNTDKPKFVAFLVFVCTTALFSAQISSFRKCLKRKRHLGSCRKTMNSKGYSELRGANQNARKLLFSDLVNTKIL